MCTSQHLIPDTWNLIPEQDSRIRLREPEVFDGASRFAMTHPAVSTGRTIEEVL
jgi:hypothetical protein